MLNTLLNHRSIRRYKTLPIPESDLNEILEAGTRASTTGNMQVYSIVVTTDPAIKEQLWECHFKQEMVRQAPVVLTFCADFNRFNQWCILRKAEPGYDNFLSFFTAAIDALLVAQNVAIAAEEKGLGICYLGTTTYMAHKIVEVLKLPNAVVPITTLVVGYPDEMPELTDRLPVSAVVHQQTYHNYTPETIDAAYKQKENMPFYRDIVQKNGKETLAQVFTDIRYTRADNVKFSQLFLQTIAQQGFMNNEL
ncbi:MAG TPA: nitroreductase family protein [Bacteroidales bacterium]|nr:nitroreductase family protein [Bacteroidales bacterium]HOK99151.1 nitroreductase family protein [Bacteroidales bacterium]